MSDNKNDGSKVKSWLAFAYVALFVIAVVAGVGILSQRYDIVVSNNPMYAYKIDKMTGHSWFIYRNRELKMLHDQADTGTPDQQVQ
ncbi:MAG: hypothetical protein DKM50_03335 [Candidatus Margulisiibacteriota bacterium]|nr:MAG: hypothetical protein A2X43_09475 [Candidatus Margulisbacteria bacterium GWD2_39_127]OGI02880.1 MAG: hypothetical protein A2X42_02290 [Candidatus Margulisbacteria bacterium GWF2_38_17]OGI09661.1 MAG: hypothetical protein A2X41_05000 [Candidatus Margulisbacteria bacterium GWE2_39_32]PZM83012.1 MAG: hypothetical protein DKM50_03335 [Candidatus Margulisiibacteriota bacterium]HAR62172.1 hypothetical protein [Candidatus Margulisiibacteriota bacterium]